MIIWLSSYPRSGNTLLRTTLHTCFGIRSSSLYSGDSKLDLPGWEAMAGHTGRAGSVESMRADGALHYVKSHDPNPDGEPAIYVVRNGADAVVSYARYALRFNRGWFGLPRVSGGSVLPRTFAGWLRRVIKGRCDFGGWSAHVHPWTSRRAPTAVIRFEDLIVDPVGQVSNALAAIGQDSKPTVGKSVPTFEELRAKWPAFFREGRVGGGVEEMTSRPELLELFDREHGEVMDAMGYARTRPPV